MLKTAQLYEEQLKVLKMKTWYDPRYMYYDGGTGSDSISLADNTYEHHAFVSVDKEDNVIGFISYRVNWCSMSAHNFGVMSFDMGNLEFIRDVYQAVVDIFERYHLNKMSWWCFA